MNNTTGQTPGITNTTSGAADLSEALRSIQRFEVVDCIDDKHVPAVIPKPHGPWVRYEDHIAALAAGQATAAQQGAYAALSESFLEIPDVQDESGINAYYSREVVLECIDAARASHGQAPAQPDQFIACSYGDNGYACCEGGPCQADVHNDKLAEQQAPAGAQADSVQEDAARYRLLRRGQHWSVIDGIGNDLRAEALDAAVDAARKQGTTP